MASITDVRLTVGNAYVSNGNQVRDVDIEFDVDWDRTDRVTNQLYTGTWTLWEKDTFAQEDGVDDRVTGKGVYPILEYRSDGDASRTETVHVAAIRNDWFDKDNAGYDEIFAEVTLTPQDPLATTGVSPHVNIVA